MRSRLIDQWDFVAKRAIQRLSPSPRDSSTFLPSFFSSPPPNKGGKEERLFDSSWNR